MLAILFHVARDEPVTLLSPGLSTPDARRQRSSSHARLLFSQLILSHEPQRRTRNRADIKTFCLHLVRVGSGVRHPDIHSCTVIYMYVANFPHGFRDSTMRFQDFEHTIDVFLDDIFHSQILYENRIGYLHIRGDLTIDHTIRKEYGSERERSDISCAFRTSHTRK